MIPMPSPGLVAYFTVVRTGSRDEVEPGHSGFAHFFEHMMFRGTKKYPGPVYDRIVTSLGAEANAFTSDDLTVFHLTFAKEDLEKVIDIESDRFQNLTTTKPAFQTEAGAVYGEYRIGAAEPVVRARREAARPGLRRPHLQAHHDRLRGRRQGDAAGLRLQPLVLPPFYRPENVVLLVVGDFDPKTTLGWIEKYYGPWRRATSRRRSRPSRRRPRRARPRSPFPAGRCRSWTSPTRATPSIRPTATTWPPGCWATWPSARRASCTRSSCCASRRSRCSTATFP